MTTTRRTSSGEPTVDLAKRVNSVERDLREMRPRGRGGSTGGGASSAVAHVSDDPPAGVMEHGELWIDSDENPELVQGDSHYVHEQGVAAATWTVEHFLSKRPAVAIRDSSGRNIEADVDYVDHNTLTITFAAAISGSAYLN